SAMEGVVAPVERKRLQRHGGDAPEPRTLRTKKAGYPADERQAGKPDVIEIVTFPDFSLAGGRGHGEPNGEAHHGDTQKKPDIDLPRLSCVNYEHGFCASCASFLLAPLDSRASRASGTAARMEAAFPAV